MTAATLLALADRVEQASGADRELDAAVWLHLPEQEPHAWKHGGDRLKHVAQIAGCSFVPPYTASLDAAMTLVPEGGGRMVETQEVQRPGRSGAWAKVTIVGNDSMSFGDEGHAATPALALIAACLRSRALTDHRESEG